MGIMLSLLVILYKGSEVIYVMDRVYETEIVLCILMWGPLLRLSPSVQRAGHIARE